MARVLVGLLFSTLLACASLEWKGQAARMPSGQEQVWPNQAPRDAHYVGSSKCIQCHDDKASQRSTPMGRASEKADECKVLRSHPLLTFRSGPFSYKVATQGNRSTLTVTNGSQTFTAPILYCFGQGKSGQTYILQHDGAFYESRVSFYNAIQGLDITIGAQLGVPATVEEAAGRKMGAGDSRGCFGCHSTAAATSSELSTERLIPGVNCESCHGPGVQHVAAMSAGKLEEKHIYNPRGLESEEMSSFCGSCHRTWEQVELMRQSMRREGRELGRDSVRFQPYRLAKSRCYDLSDRRISCTACHDPHKDLEHDRAFYDAKCAACHSSDPKLSRVGKQVARKCPVGEQKCVTCHMPSYELKGSHTTFTDHFIRVVRLGESVW
jgi:hypothetical protein